KASRAVGAANGANPLSFVVPCHRVIGKSGDITGYHWGLTRKRAILGWEAGQVAACISVQHRARFLPELGSFSENNCSSGTPLPHGAFGPRALQRAAAFAFLI